MHIEPASEHHFREILELNQESVHFLSALSAQGLADLHSQAAYHKVAIEQARVAGFLIALQAGAAYASVNYQWFDARFRNFLYIDRVVIASQFQGRGIGRLLYDDLFMFAKAKRFEQVTCEFDVEPPNPVSAKFHEAFGFRELGSHWAGDGKKKVSLQAAQLK